MTAATTSRWARLFVAFGALSFVAWQLATLVGLPCGTGVALGLYGFVFHVLFGKAYSLVPSYFDRQLAIPRAPAVHLPLTAVGTVCLAVAAISDVPPVVGTAGATLWTGGVAVFLAALGWTIRDNVTGAGDGDGRRQRTPPASRPLGEPVRPGCAGLPRSRHLRHASRCGRRCRPSSMASPRASRTCSRPGRRR